MRREALWVTLALSLLAGACGEKKLLPFEPGTGGPDPNATFTRVQGEILTPSCALAGCHSGASPASGLDLTSGVAYNDLVRVGSVERSDLFRIAPGDPEHSYLIKKVRGDADISGSRMPLGGTPLSAAQILLVSDWVRRDAPRD